MKHILGLFTAFLISDLYLFLLKIACGGDDLKKILKKITDSIKFIIFKVWLYSIDIRGQSENSGIRPHISNLVASICVWGNVV